MNVRFNTVECRVQWSRHAESRRPAILLVNARAPGDVIAVATMDLPDVALAADEVALRDFGPSAGVLEALMIAGVVSAPVRFVEHGEQQIPICTLLVDAENGAR
ncbi:MAG: hypothetical protein K9M02_10645 [Thiohalocapsa sp.]|nr:hypothetical protein [Thiohalocapsa sp.]